ncbi:hypothetical protein EDC96DRAFT_502752 [Choanephora cucurbitarum]|nr:hypothetical protein EDC96DRAFT_502752 [Choanephora cucurbitarum]
MTLSSNAIHTLNPVETQQLLGRLEHWRKGVCPNGKLAEQSSFVLQQRPCIIIHPEPNLLSVTTELITEQAWDTNLVDCGVITHLNDDAMMKTLAHFYMLFHASNNQPRHNNTLHSIFQRKHASFRVDQVSRPTRALQQALDRLTAESINSEMQWELLMYIWNTFGFLWPRKLILGYRITRRHTYTFDNPIDSMNLFHNLLNQLKDEMHSLLNNYQQHQHLLGSFQLDSFLKHSDIVARVDLDPLHLFLSPEESQKIQDIIHYRFVQVTVYQPIKIYNTCTDSYLCWDPKRSQDTMIEDNEPFDFLVRAVAKHPNHSYVSSDAQYLWRMMQTPITAQQPLPTSSMAIAGSDRVFIYPACRSSSALDMPKLESTSSWQLKERFMIDTHTMALSCRPYLAHSEEQPSRDFSKFRGLRLLPENKRENTQTTSIVDWTIEYPHNHMKYMTEAQANIKLNFQEHVRSRKPIVDGDVVQLQQIGLLTVFDPVSKSNHAKHQSNKKNVLCVDEDLTKDRWADKTYWRLELANKQDMKYHQATYCSWPPTFSSSVHQEIRL